MVTASWPLCSNSDGWLDDHYEGALPPGSIGSVGGVSDRISAIARKQIAHQLPKCEGRNGLMGVSLIRPLVLKEER